MKDAGKEFLNMAAGYLAKSDLFSIQIKTDIASMIINARYEKGMTQAQFANYMGVTQGMVSKWESGEYNFTVDTISEICHKLSIVPSLEFKVESDHLRDYIRKKNTQKDWVTAPVKGRSNNPMVFGVA